MVRFHVTSPDYLTNPLLRFSIDGVTYENQTGAFTYLAPGTYSVTYRITANGCTSPATEVVIHEGPRTPTAPVVTVIQPTCDVSTGTITVTSPAPQDGYFYSIDYDNYTNTSGVFTGVLPGTYGITVKTTAGCVSVSTYVTLKAQDGEQPAQPGEFTESTTYMCAGTAATYAVPFENSVTYLWSFSGQGATISGSGNSVNINFSPTATSGILSVAAVNNCGTSPARELYITVRQLPGPAGVISGETYVCPGARGVVYTVAVIPNAVHYKWTVPTGATIVSGDDTNSITVDFSENAESGVITVQGWKVCGTGEVSPDLNIIVKPMPDPAGNITGQNEVCQGTKAVVYSVPLIKNAVHYIWTVPSGATIVSGNDSNTITVNFSENAESGFITVQGSKSCGTGAVSPEFRVTVKPKPQTPVISLADGVLSSNALIGNQWYLAENPLTDATNDKYIPLENGSYFTLVTLNGCISLRSNVVDVLLPEKGLKNTDIAIYPVPSKGDFTVTIKTEDEKTIDILVFNSSGNKVHEIHNVIIKDQTVLPFELGMLPAGIYYLRFTGADGQAIKTIIITR